MQTIRDHRRDEKLTFFLSLPAVYPGNAINFDSRVAQGSVLILACKIVPLPTGRCVCLAITDPRQQTRTLSSSSRRQLHTNHCQRNYVGQKTMFSMFNEAVLKASVACWPRLRVCRMTFRDRFVRYRNLDCLRRPNARQWPAS
jgi:hypothetical protein